jgi:hypothetical protein
VIVGVGTGTVFVGVGGIGAGVDVGGIGAGVGVGIATYGGHVPVSASWTPGIVALLVNVLGTFFIRPNMKS